MNRIFSVSRLLTRAPTLVGSKRIPLAPAAFIPARSFATKKSSVAEAEVVSSTSKKDKDKILHLLEEELTVLKATNIGDDHTENRSLRTDLATRFLDEYGFKTTEDKEAGVIIIRNIDNKKYKIEISFADRPVENEEYEDQEGEENTEETTSLSEPTEQEKEETEDEEAEGEEDRNKREQPFRIEISSVKAGKELKFLLNCFASSDGSFIVSELNVGDGKRIPVPIGQWNEDLQRELIQWLDTLGVNEKLSYFIHEHLDKRMHEDNLKTVEEFKDFIRHLKE